MFEDRSGKIIIDFKFLDGFDDVNVQKFLGIGRNRSTKHKRKIEKMKDNI